MAKGKITIDYTAGCVGIYNQLNALGMVTAVAGTPSVGEAIFTGPYCASGTYLRIKISNNGNQTSNNGMNIEIGTVSGSTFTSTRVVKTLNTTADLSRTNLTILYDTTENIIIVISHGGTSNNGELFYIGKTDSGVKITFMASWEATNGIFPTNAADVTTSYKLITLRNKFSNGTNYYESKIYITNADGLLLLNGSSPAYLVGVSSLGVVYSRTILANDNWVIFGAQYCGANTNENNLFNQLKFNIT